MENKSSVELSQDRNSLGWQTATRYLHLNFKRNSNFKRLIVAVQLKTFDYILALFSPLMICGRHILKYSQIDRLTWPHLHFLLVLVM